MFDPIAAIVRSLLLITDVDDEDLCSSSWSILSKPFRATRGSGSRFDRDGFSCKSSTCQRTLMRRLRHRPWIQVLEPPFFCHPSGRIERQPSNQPKITNQSTSPSPLHPTQSSPPVFQELREAQAELQRQKSQLEEEREKPHSWVKRSLSTAGPLSLHLATSEMHLRDPQRSLGCHHWCVFFVWTTLCLLRISDLPHQVRCSILMVIWRPWLIQYPYFVRSIRPICFQLLWHWRLTYGLGWGTINCDLTMTPDYLHHAGSSAWWTRSVQGTASALPWVV